MGNSRCLKLAVFMILTVLAADHEATAVEEWPAISNDEKTLKDCLEHPGAPAVCLYHEEISTVEDATTSIFRRLKILTPAGKDHANIEIPVLPGFYKMKDLKARVVRPDGESREFSGEVYDKTVLRAGRLKVTVKAFYLPDVDVGSIIDYRYKLVPDGKGSLSGDSQELLNSLLQRRGKPEEGGMATGTRVLSWPLGKWEIQDALFTYKAKFVYIPIHMGQALVFGQSMRLGWLSYGVPWEPEMRGNRIELELFRIPALETEEYMAPENPGDMGVHFFLWDNTIMSASEYWKEECANWQKNAEDFMDLSDDVTAESRKLVLEIKAPMEKIKALYERAQRIKNLSYDRSMTRQRRKELKIKANHKAADVLKRDYGLRSDITRSFVALARAAGYRAEVARAVTRDDKFFHEYLISLYGQFDSELAVVKVGDKEILLDPATPFCPMGAVRWNCSDTTYIRTSTTPPGFLSSPASTPEGALTRREFALQLDLLGNLSGTAKVTFSGQEALVRRLDHIDSDDMEVKKSLESEMSAILSGDAKVSLRKLENMKNSEDAIRADFDITMAGVAVAAGQRMLLSVSPLQGSRQYPFSHARRKTSVYFPYPFREFNDIVISLPDGVNVESTPAACQVQRSFSEHSRTCAVEAGSKLHIQRDLVIRKSLIPVDLYPFLKSFFDRVKAGDEEQVVLSLEKK
jgi:hypothetical protein